MSKKSAGSKKGYKTKGVCGRPKFLLHAAMYVAKRRKPQNI